MCILLLCPVTHTLHKTQLLTLQAFQLTVLYSSMYHLAPKRKRKKSYDFARFQIEMQCKRIHNTYVIDFLPLAALLFKKKTR